MKIVKASAAFTQPIDGKAIMRALEEAGRICYKSEDKMTDDSAGAFVLKIIRLGHESVLEHEKLTARIICDRGVSHELVRHRLASYSQESTRYCNYGKDGFGGEITVIRPCFLLEGSPAWRTWECAMNEAECGYFEMLNDGCTPQEARSVLPNSLKTEVVMTANLREWRHFFKLRCAPAAHPQMREVAKMLLEEARAALPAIFEDIEA